ncbi:MAG: phosphotransferase [Chloroflexi bacterium]|nr:phosphotransferase [Chloroflexota bacterium]MDA1010795.1 phosphotransferase [Chloroflexota bacterium]
MPDLPRLSPALRAALAEALPGVRASRALRIGEGWGAIAYRLPAADGDAGGDWVLRTPRVGVPWAADDLAREARMLPLLATRPFEVTVPTEPRLLTGPSGETLGALHRLVSGSMTAKRRLAGAQRQRHLAGIGRFLATLHTTPAAMARRHGVEVRDMWSEVSRPRIDATMAIAGPATRRWLAQQVEAFESLERSAVPSVLIHGDISPENLLADEQGHLSGVIDFAEARLSDPALDFAGVLHRFTRRDLDVVLRHYEAPIDATLIERVVIYIAISPVYSVTDGYIALGAHERTVGLQRLAARAAQSAKVERATRNQPHGSIVPSP